MRRIAAALVRGFDYAMPDPYVFAVMLTAVTALLALGLAPHGSPANVLTAWYKGIFDILTFALQMILILATGYALAQSAPVRTLLARVAAVPATPQAAGAITFGVSALACWLNWGFGLVIGGLLARTIARRLPVEFGWLTACAYAGFVVWASGLSSSIALAQATPGSSLNLVQHFTGTVLPLTKTIFTPFNLVPVAILVFAVPALLVALRPTGADVERGNVAAFDVDAETKPAECVERTPAALLDNAWIVNVTLAAAGVAYLAMTWSHGFALDVNTVIFVFFLAGLVLHRTPRNYVAAMNGAAAITGPLLLQYPLYGGIMGIISATGLAGTIAAWFTHVATAATLPFWSYLASILISLFVPSGGGHWAVQGPFVVPAAASLGASQAATAMAVAVGEEVANMIQPFWCLPVLTIAGVGLQRVMAYTAIVFAVAFAVFGASLLLLVPR